MVDCEGLMMGVDEWLDYSGGLIIMVDYSGGLITW